MGKLIVCVNDWLSKLWISINLFLGSIEIIYGLLYTESIGVEFHIIFPLVGNPSSVTNTPNSIYIY